MTVREKLLPVVAKLRGVSDTKLGLRRYRAFVRRERASDERGGRGSTTVVTDTLLAEKPRIREAGGSDVVSSGGRIQSGDLIMDRVTPRNAAGTVGVTIGTIALEPSRADEKVFVVLDGPEMPPYVAGPPPSGGGEFTVVSANGTGNFELVFVLRPRTGKR